MQTTEHPAPTPEDPTAEPARRSRRAPPLLVLAGLIAVGAAALEVGAIFPSQGSGFSTILHAGPELSVQIVLAVGLLAGAVLLMAGAVRGAAVGRAGALLVLGITAGSAGLVASTFVTNLAATAGGFGLWLQAAALVVAAVAVALGLLGSRAAAHWRPLERSQPEGVAFTIVGIVGAAVLGYALLPAWDRYRTTADTGQVLHHEAGSVFTHNTPTGVLIATVVAALAFFVLPAVAVRPGSSRLLAFAAGGVLVVVAAQCLSGVVQMGGNPGLFTPDQISRYSLVTTTSLTVWYDLEVLAVVVVLAALAARWFDQGRPLADEPSAPGSHGHGPQGSTARSEDRPAFVGWGGPSGVPGLPPRPDQPPS